VVFLYLRDRQSQPITRSIFFPSLRALRFITPSGSPAFHSSSRELGAPRLAFFWIPLFSPPLITLFGCVSEIPSHCDDPQGLVQMRRTVTVLRRRVSSEKPRRPSLLPYERSGPGTFDRSRSIMEPQALSLPVGPTGTPPHPVVYVSFPFPVNALKYIVRLCYGV